jgi:hypothetical protein
MAIVFMVVAECGDDEECAQSIVSHFMRVRWLLSDGTSMQFLSEPTHVWRRGNIFWCSVIPEGVSLTGDTQRITSAEIRAEIANRTYAELRTVDCFRFALVGWEVADECDWESILTCRGNPNSLPLGLVISEELWSELGPLPGFERFGPRSWWKPLSDQDYLKLVESW